MTFDEFEYVPSDIRDEVDRLLRQDFNPVVPEARDRLETIARHYATVSDNLKSTLNAQDEPVIKKLHRYHLPTLATTVLCLVTKADPVITGMAAGQFLLLGEMCRHNDKRERETFVEAQEKMSSYQAFAAGITSQLSGS